MIHLHRHADVHLLDSDCMESSWAFEIEHTVFRLFRRQWPALRLQLPLTLSLSILFFNLLPLSLAALIARPWAFTLDGGLISAFAFLLLIAFGTLCNFALVSTLLVWEFGHSWLEKATSLSLISVYTCSS